MPSCGAAAKSSAPIAESRSVGSSRIGYRPGLDGLRAVALLAIFVVHADMGLASGGFLAVSTFFTLSGFLITSLLFREYHAYGRIGLREFWMGRARRLLPASILIISAISMATLLLGSAGQIRRLPLDALAAVTYVANWRFVFMGDRYGAGFEGEPTLLHFWSLAIEEQFYLIFPLLCLAAFGLARRWRAAAAVVLLVAVAASLASGIVGSFRAGRVDRLYFGTDVRAAELLVGALVGLWWVTRPERPFPGARWIGPIALTTMLVLIATAHHQDLLWYRGGLIAYALVTSVVVLTAIEPTGLVATVLSWRPLVGVGIVSYGAYLVHWPIFLWLRTATSLSGVARFAVGTGLSIALAGVSYRLLEAPIRRRRLFTDRMVVGLSASIAVLVVMLDVVVAPMVLAGRGEMALADAGSAFERSLAKTRAAPGEAPTVAVFGDSTALVTSVALASWDDTNPTIRTIAGWANLGCSITFPGEVRNKGVTSPRPSALRGLAGRLETSCGGISGRRADPVRTLGSLRAQAGGNVAVRGDRHPRARCGDRAKAGCRHRSVAATREGGRDRYEPPHRARPIERTVSGAPASGVRPSANGPTEPDHPGRRPAIPSCGGHRPRRLRGRSGRRSASSTRRRAFHGPDGIGAR